MPTSKGSSGTNTPIHQLAGCQLCISQNLNGLISIGDAYHMYSGLIAAESERLGRNTTLQQTKSLNNTIALLNYPKILILFQMQDYKK